MNTARHFLTSIRALGKERIWLLGGSHRRPFCHSLVPAVLSGDFAGDQIGIESDQRRSRRADFGPTSRGWPRPVALRHGCRFDGAPSRRDSRVVTGLHGRRLFSFGVAGFHLGFAGLGADRLGHGAVASHRRGIVVEPLPGTARHRALHSTAPARLSATRLRRCWSACCWQTFPGRRRRRCNCCPDYCSPFCSGARWPVYSATTRAPPRRVSAQFLDVAAVIKNPAFLGLSVSTGLLSMSRLIILTFLPIYLQEHLHYSSVALGIYIALLHVMGTHLATGFGLAFRPLRPQGGAVAVLPLARIIFRPPGSRRRPAFRSAW